MHRAEYFFFAVATSPASNYLRANGITLFKVRDEIPKIIKKDDSFYFSPEHPPLTEEAQRALDWAVDQKLNSGSLLLFLSYTVENRTLNQLHFCWFLYCYLSDFSFPIRKYASLDCSPVK